jgi:hypothetical protein
MSLIDAFMTPTCAPTIPYAPESDVVSWSPANDAAVVAEVFVRPEGTFGFRCSAWVAWRDAGGEVRSHSWWHVWPPDTLFTDSLSYAQASASAFLASKRIHAGVHWHAV